MWPQTLWVVEQTWQPDSVRQAELKLTVEEVSAADCSHARSRRRVLLSGTGPLKLYPTGKVLKTVENRYDARLEGVLVYDRTDRRDHPVGHGHAGRLQRLLVRRQRRLEGGRRPRPRRAWASPSSWTRPRIKSRRSAGGPRSFVHAYIFRDREHFYWDPEKWEDDWKKRQRR